VRVGRRLGVDVGSVRIGVAVSDADGTIAVAVETVSRGSARSDADLERLAILAADHDAIEVVVGLPISLSGTEGPAAVGVREYAGRLARKLPVPIRLVDERLTTADAQRALTDAGVSGKRSRTVIDQAAAAMILQNALDAERATGIPPGATITADAADASDQGGT
jgi:putative Holliday junction resolvase